VDTADSLSRVKRLLELLPGIQVGSTVIGSRLVTLSLAVKSARSLSKIAPMCVAANVRLVFSTNRSVRPTARAQTHPLPEHLQCCDLAAFCDIGWQGLEDRAGIVRLRLIGIPNLPISGDAQTFGDPDGASLRRHSRLVSVRSHR